MDAFNSENNRNIVIILQNIELPFMWIVHECGKYHYAYFGRWHVAHTKQKVREMGERYGLEFGGDNVELKHMWLKSLNVTKHLEALTS